MREIRTSGSEGGGTEPNRFSLPLSENRFKDVLKGKSRRGDPSGFQAQRLELRDLTTRIGTLLRLSGRVKDAAVLAVGLEPTRATAQRVVKPSRLPVSPRQHQNRQRAMATQGARRAISHPFRTADTR